MSIRNFNKKYGCKKLPKNKKMDQNLMVSIETTYYREQHLIPLVRESIIRGPLDRFQHFKFSFSTFFGILGSSDSDDPHSR